MISEDTTKILVGMIQQLQADVRDGVGELRSALANKADKSDIARIESEIAEHRRQIADLQKERDSRETAASVTARARGRWRWLFETAVAVAAAVALLLEAIPHV
jgi:hypothetical protein